jgi:hypothetical protein
MAAKMWGFRAILMRYASVPVVASDTPTNSELVVE